MGPVDKPVSVCFYCGVYGFMALFYFFYMDFDSDRVLRVSDNNEVNLYVLISTSNVLLQL